MVRCATLVSSRSPCRWRLMYWFAMTGMLTVLWLATAAGASGQSPDEGAGQAKGGDVEQASAPADSAEKAPTLDLKAMERRIKATLAKVTPAVVAVSGGSGVVVSEDGYVLTVAHVGSRSGRRLWVTFPDGRRVQARTLGNDRGVDAGMIKLSGNGPYPHVDMGVSKDIEPGQWCLALGYPVSFERGKSPAVRVGRVLSNRDTSIVTDCTIMGGDSGGPLFDIDGNVIGISSRCDGRLTVNIHVPVDCYQNTWDRLAQSEDFNSLSRGIAFLGVARDEETDAAKIGEVFPRTGASRAGIKAGDVFLKFDGEELSKYSELPPLIEKHKPGDEVEIVLRRGDETITVKARLGDRDE